MSFVFEPFSFCLKDKRGRGYSPDEDMRTKLNYGDGVEAKSLTPGTTVEQGRGLG